MSEPGPEATDAGLVDSQRRGTYVYYWIQPEALGALSTLLAVESVSQS